MSKSAKALVKIARKEGGLYLGRQEGVWYCSDGKFLLKGVRALEVIEQVEPSYDLLPEGSFVYRPAGHNRWDRETVKMDLSWVFNRSASVEGETVKDTKLRWEIDTRELVVLHGESGFVYVQSDWYSPLAELMPASTIKRKDSVLTFVRNEEPCGVVAAFNIGDLTNPFLTAKTPVEVV